MKEQDMVLGFLVEGYDPIDKILLGFKNKGWAIGNYNGFGGKVEKLEDSHKAMVREFKEELGIEPDMNYLESIGSVRYIYPIGETAYMEVFTLSKWEGDIVPESGESLEWFNAYNFPFDNMLPYDVHWFPFVLHGLRFNCNIILDDNLKLIQANTFCESVNL